MPDRSQLPSLFPPPSSPKNSAACAGGIASASPKTIIVGIASAATSSDQS